MPLPLLATALAGAKGFGAFLGSGGGQALLGGGQLVSGLLGMKSGKKAAKKARKRQEQMLAMALAGLDKVAAKYRPGSDYAKRLMKDLEIQGKKQIAGTVQQRLRSGVGGTTYADVQAQYQTHQGRRERLGVEDYLSQKHDEVMRQRSALLGSVNVSGPSESALAGAGQMFGQGLGTLAAAFMKKKEPVEMSNPVTSIPASTRNYRTSYGRYIALGK